MGAYKLIPHNLPLYMLQSDWTLQNEFEYMSYSGLSLNFVLE